MKKTGNIQLVFKPGVKGPKEVNQAKGFKGWFDLLKKIFRAYHSGAYKTYIFFDQKIDK